MPPNGGLSEPTGELQHTPGREGMGWVLSPTDNRCCPSDHCCECYIPPEFLGGTGKNELQTQRWKHKNHKGLLQSSAPALSYTEWGGQWNLIQPCSVKYDSPKPQDVPSQALLSKLYFPFGKRQDPLHALQGMCSPHCQPMGLASSSPCWRRRWPRTKP